MFSKASNQALAASKRQSNGKQLLLCGIIVGFFMGVAVNNSLVDFNSPPCKCGPEQQEQQPVALHAAEPKATAVQQQQDDAWDPEHALRPLERSSSHKTFSHFTVDTFTPFHQYMAVLGVKASNPPVDFKELPLFSSWHRYFEGYHNHMARFRGKKVVFMEIGVQSGGKIALMRKYFGPGFEYVGIDVNPSTKMFESEDWVHIEIGDSGDPKFLQQIKEKYPHVDIFLDDGGHKMHQQMTAFREMLPHVQPDGIFICEDLSTSWTPLSGGVHYGGVKGGHAGNPDFLQKTAVGLVHRTLDWFMAGYFTTAPMRQLSPDEIPDDLFPEDKDWWKVIPSQVKHIHYYNQLVVYEKGLAPANAGMNTVGMSIPYRNSGTHPPVDWKIILAKLDSFLGPN